MNKLRRIEAALAAHPVETMPVYRSEGCVGVIVRTHLLPEVAYLSRHAAIVEAVLAMRAEDEANAHDPTWSRRYAWVYPPAARELRSLLDELNLRETFGGAIRSYGVRFVPEGTPYQLGAAHVDGIIWPDESWEVAR